MMKDYYTKSMRALQLAGIYNAIDPCAWNKSFNINCQAAANSHHSIKYLAPYVFKVAISDSRVVNLENRNVVFRYKKPNSQRWRTMALDVMEFMRRFLQHVLPTGFMKIRYYGFMSPASSVSLGRVRSLIELSFGFEVQIPAREPESVYVPSCPDCDADLKLRCHIFASPLPSFGYG